MTKFFSSLTLLLVFVAINLNAINFRKISINNMSLVLMPVEKNAGGFIETDDLRYEVISELLKSAGSPSTRRVTIFLDYKYVFLNPSMSAQLNKLDEQIFTSQETEKKAIVLSTYNNRDQYPVTARSPVVYSNKARILYGFLVGANTIIRSNDSIVNTNIKNIDALFYQSVVRVASNDKKENEGAPQETDSGEATATQTQNSDSIYQNYVDARDKAKEEGNTMYKTVKYPDAESFINATRKSVVAKIQNISPNFPNQYGALMEVYDSKQNTLTYYLIGVYRGDFIKYIWPR